MFENSLFSHSLKESQAFESFLNTVNNSSMTLQNRQKNMYYEMASNQISCYVIHIFLLSLSYFSSSEAVVHSFHCLLVDDSVSFLLIYVSF